jgi:hypothetical protein
MNAINVIAPYKYHGQWVFDDPRVGLSQEPFVAGADTWIDRFDISLKSSCDRAVVCFATLLFDNFPSKLSQKPR